MVTDGGGRVGEIIEATSSDLMAQSVRLHAAPPFGSLVRVPYDAFTSECVTWMMVAPLSLSERNSSMISLPCAE